MKNNPMNKQQEFNQVYSDYTTTTFELITTMFNNLNPNMPADQAGKINELFHKTTDLNERIIELGKSAAKEMIKEEEKSFIPLAN